MRVSVYQPSYMPWAGLLHRIVHSDAHVILDTVQRSHGDFSNRNRIKTHQGVEWLTVPVRGSRNTLLKNVETTDGSWRRKHLRTLELAYSKAPYWDEHSSRLEELLHQDTFRLVRLDDNVQEWMLSQVEAETPVMFASQLAGLNGAKSELLVSICQSLNADEYLSGPMGRDYLDTSLFLKAGVRISYHDWTPKPYPQLHGTFHPCLSAIDLILNCGPMSKDYL